MTSIDLYRLQAKTVTVQADTRYALNQLFDIVTYRSPEGYPDGARIDYSNIGLAFFSWPDASNPKATNGFPSPLVLSAENTSSSTPIADGKVLEAAYINVYGSPPSYYVPSTRSLGDVYVKFSSYYAGQTVPFSNYFITDARGFAIYSYPDPWPSDPDHRSGTIFDQSASLNATITVVGSLFLFTESANDVDFISLRPDQVAAVRAGADLYHSLAGNDVVHLPTRVNNLGGTGISYNLDLPFNLGDGTDTLYGSPDGPTNVVLGTGVDTVYAGVGAVTATFGSSLGTLVLVNQGATALPFTVNNFTTTNALDLKGWTANQTLFNPTTNTVDLFDVAYGQNQATKVGSVHLSGDFSGKIFALADDGAGGRLLKAEDAPDDLTLSRLSAATYGGAAPAPYRLIDSRRLSGGLIPGGLLVDEFQVDDNIVLAIRGTDPSFPLINLLKNLVADASFASFAANERLSEYVRAASEFLKQVRQANPYANITLTGHSLGGAIADLIGSASRYRTVAFNPPGAAKIADSLFGELVSARDAATTLDGGRLNIRVIGDQVSQVGLAIGEVKNLFDIEPGPTSWWDVPRLLERHSIDTIAGILGRDHLFGNREEPLHGFETGISTFERGLSVAKALSTVIRFAFNVVQPFIPLSIDPPAASFYTLVENPGSPGIASITLPKLDGIAGYRIAVERGGTWSSDALVAPGVAYGPDAPFEAVRFSPLDGSSSIVAINSDIIFDASFASVGIFNGTLTASPAATRSDVSGDARGDLLWQSQDGTPSVWAIRGGAVRAYLNYQNPGAGWRLVGTGDLNGDGRADLVWQNRDGLPSGWLVGTGGAGVQGYPVFANPGADWRLVGTGDLNGDGRDDLLWQRSDGLPSGWIMGPDGTTVAGYPVFANPGSDWRLAGAADLNGDGRDDLLWQRSDGLPSAWLMNRDGTGVQGYPVFQNPGASWRLVGGADLNGDGRDDLLWQNGDGLPSGWLMDEAGTGVAGYPVFANPGASWTLTGATDANGDGRADLVWQNASGLPSLWLMGAGGTSVDAYPVLDNPGANWRVV